jgi:hypothetical protein
VSVTKLATRKTNNTVNYATTEDIIEQLHIFDSQMNWSIFEILELLKQRKADSLSIIKEKPFHYFYARLSKNDLILSLQTSEQETEFRIPIESVTRPKRGLHTNIKNR